MQHDYQLYRMFARHCGAVLLGKKPAGLFSVPDDAITIDAVDHLARATRLKAIVMQSERGRALLFVYSPELLDQALSHKTARRMLERLGYPCGGSAEQMLRHLKERVTEGNEFPHEVGFFLGYPPADVVGFIVYGGKNPKHSCMWKVYGSVETAENLCSLYRECQRHCFNHLENHGHLPFLVPSLEAN